MASLTCRQCSAEVTLRSDQCRGCGCPAPFSCAACGKRLSSVSLGLERSSTHPHGTFSPEGLPLCHAHRLTRCSGCESLFPRERLNRRVVGTYEDTHLREGKPPRVEPVYHFFCPDCPGTESGERDQDPQSSQGAGTGMSTSERVMVAALLGVLVLIGLLLVLLRR